MPADWNAIATLQPEGFADALRTLGRFGKVRRSRYYNVLALTVADGAALLAGFAALLQNEPGTANFISHLFAAQHCFDFADADQFRAAALAPLQDRLDELAGRGFHLRVHRRGMKGQLASQPAEQSIDGALLAALAATGRPGHISFDDPDVIVQIETIDGRAGLSLWHRGDLRRFPFLGVD